MMKYCFKIKTSCQEQLEKLDKIQNKQTNKTALISNWRVRANI